MLLRNNGLHIEILVDPESPVGSTDAAGIKDVMLESAITTIMDFEDSVAAVDADDKVLGYRNWLGLNRGDLTEEVTKGGKTFTRTLNEDRTYTTPDGEGELTLPGRSLLFVRNVGHLMTNDAIVDAEGKEIFEGIQDALFTSSSRCTGSRPAPTMGGANGPLVNSRTGSVYIVKPKMHGPEEVAYTVELFSRVEDVLGLPANTLKVGIMDEERRTTVNLKACIKAAADRVVFINTGFLDRTGDEIHTSMEAGPMIRKGAMKGTEWIKAYEDQNVDIGLAAGFFRTGPDRQGHVGHDRPDGRHGRPEDRSAQGRRHHRVGAVADGGDPARDALPRGRRVRGAQGTRGQAAHQRRAVADRAAGQGAGLGARGDPRRGRQQLPVDPRLRGAVDRRRCRLLEGARHPQRRPDGRPCDAAYFEPAAGELAAARVITPDDVVASLKRMAAVVDQQNASDPPDFKPMATDPPDHSIAFQAAQELILSGAEQPNGYTEPILHRRRREYKAANGGA